MKTEVMDKIYSGVLGKIVGVYMGRPVEGWSYESIQNRFGDIQTYVADTLHIPLIVADDDISGTFGFFRAMEDAGYPSLIDAKTVGEAWLNYIIEDKTILWWGGLGRSTEHTAYLRLKAGIEAPKSGSIELNGKTLAEQIGAQIFMDAFAMMCPGDPDKAAYLVREAASVSHGGLALDAASYLGAMEAHAFVESDLESLLDQNLRFISSPQLLSMIEDVRNICSRHDATNWRSARAEIAMRYGYDKFNGPCHIIPNHALVLASLILGKDDFLKSISIASSAAWDTDCNAGNVGCLNGIRLGLHALDIPSFLRAEVADRLLVVTGDGGSCISDAVIETRNIIRAMDPSVEDTSPRFGFEFPGSVQGFTTCPYHREGGFVDSKQPLQFLENGNMKGLENGLLVSCGKGTDRIAVSTPTYIDYSELAQNFSTIASPSLYEGQDVSIGYCVEKAMTITPYVLYYDIAQTRKVAYLGNFDVVPGQGILEMTVPALDGMPIFRFGMVCEASEESVATLRVTSVDWSNTPRRFAQCGMLMHSIWETRPYWFQSWVGSAKQFAADFTHTFCISNVCGEGIETIGTQDWTDYTVRTHLQFSLHQAGGLVVRAKGLRKYVSVLFSGHDKLEIVERDGDQVKCLAQIPFSYEEDVMYPVVCTVVGDSIQATIGQTVIQAAGISRTNGSAGYLIQDGTMVARDFIVERC